MQTGEYGWAAFNAVMFVSDVFLVKSIATAVGKGAWKLGAHSWSATRKWMLEKGYVEAGEPLHHWAISQAFAKKYGLEAVSNQPWNLIKFSDQASHMTLAHGQTYMGVKGANAFGQLWYGTPIWLKTGMLSTGGRIGN